MNAALGNGWGPIISCGDQPFVLATAWVVWDVLFRNVFKALTQVLFYQVQCIWFYVIFDSLGLEVHVRG